jgi:cellulose synthase/poly-beta-1,6-N-acetylglucosamine synthase-like glycosyltransferase
VVKIAAVIPAYNEALVIKRTIGRVLATGMPKGDVYVLDDGSIDDTASLAEACGVNVLRNPRNKGKAETVTNALRTLGLYTRYTHVAFLDADTLLDRGYFKAVRTRLKNDSTVDVVCGHPKSLPHNWLTAWRAFQYFIADKVSKPAQCRIGAITVAPGCATTYSVGVLRNIKWTGDTPTEDMDATIQAAMAGAKIVYETKAIVYTQDPATLHNYIGQVGKRWLAGAWQVMHKYGLLWTGWTRWMNWDCRFIYLEPFIYVIPLILFYRRNHSFFRSMIATFVVTSALAAFASIKEKRWDIVLYSPIYPLMWVLDLMLFLWTSPNIITGPRFKQKGKWYAVQRYELPTTPQKKEILRE